MTTPTGTFSLSTRNSTRMLALAVASLIVFANLVIMAGFFFEIPAFWGLASSQTPLLIGGIELLLIIPFVYRLSADSDTGPLALEEAPAFR